MLHTIKEFELCVNPMNGLNYDLQIFYRSPLKKNIKLFSI